MREARKDEKENGGEEEKSAVGKRGEAERAPDDADAPGQRVRELAAVARLERAPEADRVEGERESDARQGAGGQGAGVPGELHGLPRPREREEKGRDEDEGGRLREESGAEERARRREERRAPAREPPPRRERALQ